MNFIKYIEQSGRKVGRSKAFCDFLTFAVCALSMQTKEDEYLATAKKYTSDEMMSFSKAFAELTNEMDNQGEGLKDCLGDYFMEILSNERTGQFFTPQCICDMMAQMTHPSERTTVNDCCCGSGRMLLSAAKINRNMVFYGADIDLQCCQMTIINMCLNGLCGQVSHMDSLKVEEWRRWEIKIHPLHFVPYVEEMNLTKVEIQAPPAIKEIPKTQIKAKQTTLELMFEDIDLML